MNMILDAVSRESVIEIISKHKIPAKAEMLALIELLPSIGPIRCKDCKWWDDSDHCPCVVEAKGCRYITDLGNDGFCSYGERKEGE